MRASSWKNTRTRLPPCVSAMSLRSCAPLFKGLLRGLVFLRVARSRLLSREPKPSQHSPYRSGMVRHLPFLAHDASEVLARVGRHTFLLDIRTGDHDRTQLLLLDGVQTARPARLRPIVETVDPLNVVALDGV